jgi:hypothetical protein
VYRLFDRTFRAHLPSLIRARRRTTPARATFLSPALLAGALVTLLTTIEVALLWPSTAFAESTLADPTRPPDVIETTTTTESTRSSLHLTAILVAKGRRVAVINGEPVQNGDTVQDAEVLAIRRDRVLLKTSTGELTLRLLATTLETAEVDEL